jgi:hypothetical protein
VLGGFRRTGGGGVALEHSLPFGAQLLMAERCLCVNSARGVLSDYEVEKLIHYFCSPPAEREKKFMFGNFRVYCKPCLMWFDIF